MSYNDSIREQAIEALQKGITEREISMQLGVPRPTIYRWKESLQPPMATIPAKELKAFRRQMSALKSENDILRKAGCSEISPLSVRQEAFLRLKDSYPLKTLARVLGAFRWGCALPSRS